MMSALKKGICSAAFNDKKRTNDCRYQNLSKRRSYAIIVFVYFYLFICSNSLMGAF